MPHPKGGYHINGVSVPGVTTIINRFKDSGGLLYWAFEQGKAAQRGEIQHLYDKRDEAAEAGGLAHDMVEAYNRGLPLPDLSGHQPLIVQHARQGFDNFLRWKENNRIEIIKHEIELVSEEHLFGGCPDAIGRDANGLLCLLDWKTSNHVFTDYMLQLAAYAQLWEENNPLDPLVGGYHLCRFAKEQADFSHHYWLDLTEALVMFLILRRAYEIDQRLRKRI